MPRTAQSIITGALQIAKCPNYLIQGVDQLNSLLRHISFTADFSAARGDWTFIFNTALTSTGGGNIITCGPNPLPIDYLRVNNSSGSTGAQNSSIWYLQGVAYPMVEIDLTEFDLQVQQAGIQSYPYFWAKDMAQYQPVIEVTGDLTAGSPTVANLAIIDSGSLLTSIADGMSIAGGIGPNSAIPPGATILSTTGGPPITGLTLSANATTTMTGATLMIGTPGAGYAYPPPSGAYNAMIRYQRQMPRLTVAQIAAGAYPWFADDMALEDGLAGLLMRITGDTRVEQYIGDGLGAPGEGGRFGRRMAQYRRQADDNANRAYVVELDRRRFGSNFQTLRNTKTVGW